MTNTTTTLQDLLADTTVSEKRQGSLTRAIELGADAATLIVLRDAARLRQDTTVCLPAHRYEGLSRGRGWARLGRGDSAVWGERTDAGNYRVGPGRWTVGASDGFSRKDANTWTVRHVTVGTETWTIAD